jgi:ribonuclease VapC
VIVDTSAIIAVANDEPEADLFLATMLENDCKMSLAAWLETSIVADNMSPLHRDVADQIIADAVITLVPVSIGQMRVAREAHRRFGRRSGSRARLNFGDLFSYALAVTEGEQLLFKGEDYSATDVESALS